MGGVLAVPPCTLDSLGTCTKSSEDGDKRGLKSSSHSAHQDERLALCRGHLEGVHCLFYTTNIYICNYTGLSAETKFIFYCHLIVYMKMKALEHLKIFYGK